MSLGLRLRRDLSRLSVSRQQASRAPRAAATSPTRREARGCGATRRLLEVALPAGLRRADEGQDAAHRHGGAEGQHQVGEDVRATEHGVRLEASAASRPSHGAWPDGPEIRDGYARKPLKVVAAWVDWPSRPAVIAPAGQHGNGTGVATPSNSIAPGTPRNRNHAVASVPPCTPLTARGRRRSTVAGRGPVTATHLDDARRRTRTRLSVGAPVASSKQNRASVPNGARGSMRSCAERRSSRRRRSLDGVHRRRARDQRAQRGDLVGDVLVVGRAGRLAEGARRGAVVAVGRRSGTRSSRRSSRPSTPPSCRCRRRGGRWASTSSELIAAPVTSLRRSKVPVRTKVACARPLPRVDERLGRVAVVGAVARPQVAVVGGDGDGDERGGVAARRPPTRGSGRGALAWMATVRDAPRHGVPPRCRRGQRPGRDPPLLHRGDGLRAREGAGGAHRRARAGGPSTSSTPPARSSRASHRS